MSQLVLNKLGEFLSLFLLDYDSKQLSVSLLKGIVTLDDCKLNVDILNVYFEYYVPFLHINRATVSGLTLKTPSLLNIKNRPTVLDISHIDLEVSERDFSQPSALEKNGGEWPMASAAPTAEPTGYGIMLKIVDGLRVNVTSIHLQLILNGLPRINLKSGHSSPRQEEKKESGTTSDAVVDSLTELQQQLNFSNAWFGHGREPSKFSGAPLIVDATFFNVSFGQCTPEWTMMDDLKLLRKGQGDRVEVFCVFKHLHAQSMNLNFIPHHKRTDREQKPIILLQNYPLRMKFIFERYPNGLLKSNQIQLVLDKIEFFITQAEYFEINYWVASLLYANAQQWVDRDGDGQAGSGAAAAGRGTGTGTGTSSVDVRESSLTSDKSRQSSLLTTPATAPRLRTKSSDETSLSRDSSVSVSSKLKDRSGAGMSKMDDHRVDGDLFTEDDRPDTAENHTTSDKSLFDVSSLCCPFQINPKWQNYGTFSVLVDRLIVNIMDDSWQTPIEPMSLDGRKKDRPSHHRPSAVAVIGEEILEDGEWTAVESTSSMQKSIMSEGVSSSTVLTPAKSAMFREPSPSLSEDPSMSSVSRSGTMESASFEERVNKDGSTVLVKKKRSSRLILGKTGEFLKRTSSKMTSGLETGLKKAADTTTTIAKKSVEGTTKVGKGMVNVAGKGIKSAVSVSEKAAKTAAHSTASAIRSIGNDRSSDGGGSASEGRSSGHSRGRSRSGSGSSFLSGAPAPPPPPPPKTRPPAHKTMYPKLTEDDRNFLVDCWLKPENEEDIRVIKMGDQYTYDKGDRSERKKKKSLKDKPLMMAVLTEFAFGNISLDLGHSIWRTKIGKGRAEQMFSIQMRDLDVLADSELKPILEEQIRQGFEDIAGECDDEETTESTTTTTTTEKGSKEDGTDTVSDQTEDDSVTTKEGEMKTDDEDSDDDGSRKKPRNSNKQTTTGEPTGILGVSQSSSSLSDKMTLIISSRHYKAQTFKTGYNFTVRTPFPGYRANTMCVFNFQWTRRMPAPINILGSMMDLHLKPVSLYLDPFLVFNAGKLFAGDGIINCYTIQSALTTAAVSSSVSMAEFMQQRFATRMQFDAVNITIPIAEGSTMTCNIHNVKIGSHDKLDETVHLRGLVDLSNLTSFGERSLQVMGLTDQVIEKIQLEKRRLYDESIKKHGGFRGGTGGTSERRDDLTGGASASGPGPASSSSSPLNLSNILRAPDEYPYEIHVGSVLFASSLTLDEQKYDNDFMINNVRVRIVNIRSESMNIDEDYSYRNVQPFVETEVSIRTESLDYNLELTVITALHKFLTQGGLLKLPLPKVLNRIVSKFMAREQLKIEVAATTNSSSGVKPAVSSSSETLMMKQQQKKGEMKDGLLSVPAVGGSESGHENSTSLSVSRLASEGLVMPHHGSNGVKNGKEHGTDDDSSAFVMSEDLLPTKTKHDDVRRISISSDDGDARGPYVGSTPTPPIRGAADGSDPDGMTTTMDPTGAIVPVVLPSVMDDSVIVDDDKDLDLRVVVYTNLDRAKFKLTRLGKSILEGDSVGQQLLLQYSLMFGVHIHLFGRRFDLIECPVIGPKSEQNVVTRLCRETGGHSYFEVVYDMPDGALELSYPPSFKDMALKASGAIDPSLDHTSEEKSEDDNKDGGSHARRMDVSVMSKEEVQSTVDELIQSEKSHESFLRFVIAENRAMQAKILQLSGDLAIAKSDMERYIKNATEDKIRIVEHQSELIETNMTLQEQLAGYRTKFGDINDPIPPPPPAVAEPTESISSFSSLFGSRSRLKPKGPPPPVPPKK